MIFERQNHLGVRSDTKAEAHFGRPGPADEASWSGITVVLTLTASGADRFLEHCSPDQWGCRYRASLAARADRHPVGCCGDSLPRRPWVPWLEDKQPGRRSPPRSGDRQWQACRNSAGPGCPGSLQQVKLHTGWFDIVIFYFQAAGRSIQF